MNWKVVLAYITGSVDQALLLRIEYLVTENRILRNHIKGRVWLRDVERKTLAEIGKQLGKKALEEVWTTAGLITYYMLFFIHLASRKVHVAGVTPHPDERWMVQIARNVTMEQWGLLAPGQYLIHDRDGKYCPAFQQLIDTAGVKRVPLPPRSPNLNAYAERWVRSVKEECLARLILFGEASLQHALHEYVAHYHHERNHQGKGNVLLFPSSSQKHPRVGPMQCHERLGGLLKYYTHEAA
jgi:putative transposase